MTTTPPLAEIISDGSGRISKYTVFTSNLTLFNPPELVEPIHTYTWTPSDLLRHHSLARSCPLELRGSRLPIWTL